MVNLDNVIIDQTVIENLLKSQGLQSILSLFRRTNTLQKPHRNLILRSIANYFVAKNEGAMPSPNFRRRVADAIIGLFPNLFIREALIGGNVNDGFLGNAFKYALKKHKRFLGVEEQQDEGEREEAGEGEETEEAEREEAEGEEPEELEQQVEDGDDDQESKESDDDESGLEESDNEEELEENDAEEEEGAEESDSEESDSEESSNDNAELMEYLMTTSGDDTEKVIRALQITQEMREFSIMEGDPRYILDLFFRRPEYILCDLNIWWPGKGGAFLEKKDTFKNSINIVFNEEYGTAKDFVLEIDESLQYCAKLLILLYNCKSARLTHLIKQLIKQVHHNCSTEDLKSVAGGVTQAIIIERQGDPPEYFISFDNRVVPLPNTVFTSFDCALDILFKAYHLWNLEYPTEISKLFELLDHALYKLTTPKTRSSKLMQILGKLNAHMNN